MSHAAVPATRLPSATYRIQLTKDLTFRHALALVDYWDQLGVTDVYASPFLKSRPGSTHGYDVVDPRVINPEIGTEDDLRALHEALHSRGMGLLADVVPNHLCVTTNDNVWWNDVLARGPASPLARTFDIDWHPPKRELHDKVLLPVLGDQYGKVLESGDLRVREIDGALCVCYGDRRFPLSPSSAAAVRADAARRLPSSPASNGAGTAAAAQAALEQELAAINGCKGDPHSFDRLEELLSIQSYRLSYWRVAGE